MVCLYGLHSTVYEQLSVVTFAYKSTWGWTFLFCVDEMFMFNLDAFIVHVEKPFATQKLFFKNGQISA